MRRGHETISYMYITLITQRACLPYILNLIYFILIWLQSCRLLSCSAVFLLFKIWKKPAQNCPIFLSPLTFQVLVQQAAKINKTELEKTRKCAFRKFVGRPAAANFGRKTFTGNRTDTNWSSTTFKGKISIFIVVFKVVMPFCYLRTIRLKQENFSRNNNTNYSRRHKLITHKNNCRQVFSGSRNDQPMFVNEYKFKEG